jgi:hypothetical protein
MAANSEGAAQVIFQVIAPSGILMKRLSTRHAQGWPDIGMEAEVFLAPDEVCFYRLGIREDDVPAQDQGCYGFIVDKSHHPNPNPVFFVDIVDAGFGTLCQINDTPWSGAVELIPPVPRWGIRVWDIPVYYVVGTGTLETHLENLEQRHQLALDGETLSCKKAGAEAWAQVSQPAPP